MSSSVPDIETDLDHEPPKDFHVDFADNADVALEAADGVRFNVASAHLERTSGFFSGMFSLPQPALGFDSKQTHIVLSEDANTLEILLKLVLGLDAPFDKLPAVADTQRVLRAAEKYEMPGAVSALNMHLRIQFYETSGDPLLQYAYACRHGWKDLRIAALRRCVEMNLCLEELSRAPMELKDAAILLRRRKNRVDFFVTQLRSTEDRAPFKWPNKHECRECPKSMSDSAVSLWARFQLAACLRFGAVPSLGALISDTTLQDIITQLVEHRCSCGRAQWSDIYSNLQSLIAPVPNDL